MDSLKIAPWTIECHDNSAENKNYRESIFSQGNGYMGVRGYAPESNKGIGFERSTFLAGFFEYIKPRITDMVNMPDFSVAVIKINGEIVTENCSENYFEKLNMQDGTLTRTYTFSDKNNNQFGIETIRFLSLADEHTAAVRICVTALTNDAIIEIETGIDGDVVNLPIADDQLSQNIEVAKLWGDVQVIQRVYSGGLTATTKQSKRAVAMEYRLDLHENGCKASAIEKDRYVGEIVTAEITIDAPFVLDKLISVYSYRDCENAQMAAYISAEQLISVGFDGMLTQTQAAWKSMWGDADIEVDAADEIQGAIRYNIFQLIQTDAQHDDKASIGARGLMHGRYKGCYFWDTEIFMLPMFLHINPTAAKNLLMYRYNTLADTINSAKEFSLEGARYPWMASDTGFEQCGTWDTGCCEIHITADIVYAVKRYLELTNDIEFFKNNAVEIYTQTARYWATRFTYDEKIDKYNLLFVKGPDEYCGVTSNNYYTVSLASLNLRLAIDAINRLKVEFPKEWLLLNESLCICSSEIENWEKICEKTVTHYDDDKNLWIQDDTFQKLQPLDILSHREDAVPLYHKISFDRLQRYQVLKQPDVIMLMSLLPENYTYDQKLAAFNYYEPKTLHDSTLSFGIHAMFAAQIGQSDKAWDYFEKSLYLDLHNVMKNTANEGIHTAALGATWQAVVFGFAGVWVTDKGITCKPNLPSGIKAMAFSVYYSGKKYKIIIKDNVAQVV